MASRRKKARSVGPTTRVRHLVVLDARNVMRRLALRDTEMVQLFSRLRDRAPMLETLQCEFTSISFGELALLEPKEQLATRIFFDALEELRWYVRYTEDMPTQVQLTVTRHRRLLELAHKDLERVLGPPEGELPPVIEGEVVKGRGRQTS